MKETQTENKQVVGAADFFAKAEAFFNANKKTIYIVLAAIVVVVLGFFGIKKWYVEPREQQAAEDMFAAENYFGNSEYEKALNGDETINSLGFLDIIDEYGSTKAGNLARYYAGICELQLGKFDEAIDHLKKYNGKDSFTKGMALMAQGDAEMELGDKDKALSLYQKAAKSSDNDIVAPQALFKAGMVYIVLKDNAKAVLMFEQIKEKYPNSTESREVDEYIAYAETSK